MLGRLNGFSQHFKVWKIILIGFFKIGYSDWFGYAIFYTNIKSLYHLWGLLSMYSYTISEVYYLWTLYTISEVYYLSTLYTTSEVYCLLFVPPLRSIVYVLIIPPPRSIIYVLFTPQLRYIIYVLLIAHLRSIIYVLFTPPLRTIIISVFIIPSLRSIIYWKFSAALSVAEQCSTVIPRTLTKSPVLPIVFRRSIPPYTQESLPWRPVDNDPCSASETL